MELQSLLVFSVNRAGYTKTPKELYISIGKQMYLSAILMGIIADMIQQAASSDVMLYAFITLLKKSISKLFLTAVDLL